MRNLYSPQFAGPPIEGLPVVRNPIPAESTNALQPPLPSVNSVSSVVNALLLLYPPRPLCPLR